MLTSTYNKVKRVLEAKKIKYLQQETLPILKLLYVVLLEHLQFANLKTD